MPAAAVVAILTVVLPVSVALAAAAMATRQVLELPEPTGLEAAPAVPLVAGRMCRGPMAAMASSSSLIRRDYEDLRHLLCQKAA